MSMIPKKRLEVLNVTKKNWMNKSKESPRTVRNSIMNQVYYLLMFVSLAGARRELLARSISSIIQYQ
jgi:hypothetical protein